MKIFLSIILPTILILIPVFFQIMLVIQRINKKTVISILYSTLTFVALGLGSSFAATFISMKGLNYGLKTGDPNCVTGSLTFIFLGLVITIIFIPLIGIIGAILFYKKNKINLRPTNNSID